MPVAAGTLSRSCRAGVRRAELAALLVQSCVTDSTVVVASALAARPSRRLS
jgi:hypothetical protein